MSEQELTAVLDAIEARANGATEGPWRWDEDKWLEGHRGYVLANDSVVDSKDIEAVTVLDCDAEFIANARADVPYLLTLARKQQDAIERVEALADEWLAFAGPGTPAERAYGPQTVGVEFAVNKIRAALDNL